MPPLTRRRALQGAAGALVALAGCPAPDETHDSPTPADPAVGSDGESDPEHVALRGPADGPLAWLGDGGTASPADRQRAHHELIADAETAARLSFADVDGAAEARALVESTDFETESLFVDGNRVGECYRLELCSISWTEREVDVQYGRVLRDHDVRCGADERVAVTHVVRIPAPVDEEGIEGYSSGIHGSGCRGGNRPPGSGSERSPTPVGGEPTTEGASEGTPADVARGPPDGAATDPGGGGR